jgi:hypothetical protein
MSNVILIGKPLCAGWRSKVYISRTDKVALRGILLIGCTGKPTNKIRPFLFFSINGESKAETDLQC